MEVDLSRLPPRKRTDLPMCGWFLHRVAEAGTLTRWTRPPLRTCWQRSGWRSPVRVTPIAQLAPTREHALRSNDADAESAARIECPGSFWDRRLIDMAYGPPAEQKRVDALIDGFWTAVKP